MKSSVNIGLADFRHYFLIYKIMKTGFRRTMLQLRALAI